MMKLLQYNHPSVPPTGINLSDTYILDELKKQFPLDKIKLLFKPINFKWEDLQPKKRTQKKTIDKETSK